MAISGIGVGMAATGAFISYAAITNQKPTDALRSLLKGEVTPITNRPAVVNFNPSSGETSGSSVSSPWVDAGGSILSHAALKYVGRPYQWGKNFDPPNGGGDCSGLVYRAFRDLGYNTPRLSSYAYPTWKGVKKVAAPNPGDILWWSGHVAIAVGNGNMVEAPTFGIPVRVVRMRARPLALRPQLDVLNALYRPATSRGAAF